MDFRQLCLVTMLPLLLAPETSAPASATTITVDTETDVLDATSTCSTVTIPSLPGPDTKISLREAICAANSHSGPNSISFNIDCGGDPCLIDVTADLPALTDAQTTIDGYTQPGAAPATNTTPPNFQILIREAGSGASYGLTINSSGNLVTGLYITGFDVSDVLVSGGSASGNAVTGNRLRYAGAGVLLADMTQGNTIGGDTPAERNIMTLNADGVRIRNNGAVGNTVSGNYIGLSYSGTSVVGNSFTGVRLTEGAVNNTIGGDSGEEANIITGSTYYGVLIESGAAGNRVSAKQIEANNQVGALIDTGAHSNDIGGLVHGEGNSITDNPVGVEMIDSETHDNIVSRNWITGNQSHGVHIHGGAHDNTIGGIANSIYSNGQNGIRIEGSGTTGNTVSGNHIGTNGLYWDYGNGSSGIFIGLRAQNNTIGGDAEEDRNIIFFNHDHGISIQGADTSGNVITGNWIGAEDHPGSGLAHANAGHGIYIGDQATSNTIGPDNVISGNAWAGVTIEKSHGNAVLGNLIGTVAGGTLARPNNGDGISIGLGSTNNTIGGASWPQHNVISANGDYGITIAGDGSSANRVIGNLIGTDGLGVNSLANGEGGIRLQYGPTSTTIGGNAPGAANLIAGNTGHGILIEGNDTSGNSLLGNYIGTNTYGRDLPNGDDGVHVRYSAHDNTVGPGNIVAYNDSDGVHIAGGSANIVAGNHIGTGDAATEDQGNAVNGIHLSDGSTFNIIGGDQPAERNLLLHNGSHGVRISGSTTANNTVSGNYIGTDSTGSSGLGNAFNGVSIDSGASNNVIGGSEPAETNVISGNLFGIVIGGKATTDNAITGNLVGPKPDGSGGLGNVVGVTLSEGAEDNIIGPANVIAYNSGDGVVAMGGDTIGNIITQNSVYSNAMGIRLVTGAHGGILAPSITVATPGSYQIWGTACSGCTVQVFGSNNDDGEGETYLGSALASGGSFVLAVPYLSQPYLTATATDADDGTSQFSTVYTVGLNLSPVADAGQNQTVSPDDPVLLDGSGSADPDGNLPLTYLWEQTSGPTVPLSSYTVTQPAFTAPGTSALLRFTLTVTDSLGAVSAPDEVSIVVAYDHRVSLPLVMRDAGSP